MSIDEPQSNQTLIKSTENGQPCTWESSLLEEIQALIRNVHVSNKLADYINEEFHEEIKGKSSDLTRKKQSCYSASTNYINNLHSKSQIPSRRNSVGNIVIAKKLIGSSRRNSIANSMNVERFIVPRRNFIFTQLDNSQSLSKRRISSVLINNGRRNSNVYQTTAIRCQCTVNLEHSKVNVRRRNSVVNIWGSRSTLDHAIKNNAMIPTTCTSENVNVLTCPLAIRRGSSGKHLCTRVKKISSVQKSLRRIYERRRKDRAQVNKNGTRIAFREICNDNESSDSKSDEEVHYYTPGLNNDNDVDEKSNLLLETYDGKAKESSADKTQSVENTLNTNIISASPDCTSTEPQPTQKRKTSIQIRSWELSRKLRQRRSQKRKGHGASGVI